MSDTLNNGVHMKKYKRYRIHYLEKTYDDQRLGHKHATKDINLPAEMSISDFVAANESEYTHVQEIWELTWTHNDG